MQTHSIKQVEDITGSTPQELASNYNEAGIGLGLYASKKIIESHQGKVLFESFTDNKNKFGFRIPTIPKPECYEKDICF